MKTNFDKSLGFTLHNVARMLRRSFDRQAQEIGLTRAQWSVLAHLHLGDGIQQKTLADLMDITPITLARHLDRLEVDAWIERRDDPEDRRAKRVFMTLKGRDVMETLSKLGQKVRRQVLKGISPEEEQQFMGILLRMRANLSDIERPASPGSGPLVQQVAPDE